MGSKVHYIPVNHDTVAIPKIDITFEISPSINYDIAIDLHELLIGCASKVDFYGVNVCFLQENIGLVIDEQRHNQVTHMAHAISAGDVTMSSLYSYIITILA